MDHSAVDWVPTLGINTTTLTTTLQLNEDVDDENIQDEPPNLNISLDHGVFTVTHGNAL